MTFSNYKIKNLIFLSFLFFTLPYFSLASWTNTAILNVDADYDYYGRNKIEVTLIRLTDKIYFYADRSWYNNLSTEERNQLEKQLYNLSSDFETKIYPSLTKLLGLEDNPGIDNDPKILIVLEHLKNDIGGYIRTVDNYSKAQFSLSNEGQIIYLNGNLLLKGDLNFLNYELAHEFAHLITLKQKPEADTWFYELISEFAGQISANDTSLITQKRAQGLLYSTEVNLLDFKNLEKDYGKIYLFALYLKEQFGENVFSEALKYPSIDGVISLNEALKKQGTNLNEVFLNWLITNLYNSCDSNNFKYCYRNPNLKNFTSIASAYYLPTLEKSSLSVTDSIFALEGQMHKINGGLGTIKIKFNIPVETPISKIPYIIEDINGQKKLGFIDFSRTNINEIYIEGMGQKNKAVYFVVVLNEKAIPNIRYYYSFEAFNLGNNKETEQKIILELQKQIEDLKRQILKLQQEIALRKTYNFYSSCSLFNRDLYYGMRSEEVKCLQQFLANLGDEIYPEKLITGYYGPLTMQAVKRYQAKYNLPTTGYFGPLTRAKVNQEL